MDIHSLKSVFDHAVLWVCGLGIAAIALAYAGYLLARFPGRVRRSVRTYGLPTVIALGVMKVLIDSFGLMTTFAVVVEVVVSFFVNFFVRKFFIFKG